MLDIDTRRRIDTARDILVGKVPDPKSQVEQITIALIYKLMDDMDAESEEMGGKRKFFAGDFARYGWAKLMRPGLGGHEVLDLYVEGTRRMPENPGLPPLFRSIFKNYYLPYRDPETLKMFLKVIDEFNYDHCESLGNAFEYLLLVLGSQGDAGQFLTPRHIINFIVDIVDPKKGEIILDPACGTAGFLISSYKHILRTNTDAKGNSTLTPDEKGHLAKNFKGYDISPDMVRLSLVNLYLHGFTDPHIYEYDTLTSEERWNDYADVILANPPFMSPKGGIKPHKRFAIQAKRSEVLFVDYMAEHLTPNGRAGIIVPEGIIFQSQTAYKDLRKMLAENYLVAVVSLPAGVFNPYSGVKTSILILDKSLARKTDTIAFFKIENDGFGLGAQRRAFDKNDLPQVKAELGEYLQTLRSRKPTADLQPTCGLIVLKEKIAANGDYNLSAERYREGAVPTTTTSSCPSGRFMKEGVKTIDPRNTPDEIFELWSIPAFDAGSPELLRGREIGSQKKVVRPMMFSCRELSRTFGVGGLSERTRTDGVRSHRRSGLSFRAMKLCPDSFTNFSFRIFSMFRSCRRLQALAVRSRAPIRQRSVKSKSPCRRWRCRRKSWRRSRATRKSSTAPAPSSTTTAPTSPSTPTGQRWNSVRYVVSLTTEERRHRKPPAEFRSSQRRMFEKGSSILSLASTSQKLTTIHG